MFLFNVFVGWLSSVRVKNNFQGWLAVERLFARCGPVLQIYWKSAEGNSPAAAQISESELVISSDSRRGEAICPPRPKLARADEDFGA